MKIVYCIFSLARRDGMQRVLTTKANYLSRVGGHDIHIVTRDSEAMPPAFPLWNNITIHRFNEEKYRQKLNSFLLSEQPDITICMFGKEMSFLYKFKDGSKKVLEFHYTRNYLIHLIKGIPHLQLRTLRLAYARFLQQKEKYYAKQYDKLVLLTEADRKLWGNPANAVTIANPLSFNSERCSLLMNHRIIAIGRFIATKGFDLLIEAFRPVAEQYPQWKLSIYGDGQDKEYLLNKIKQYHLQEAVELLPPTSDTMHELLKSDIYAFSSRYDGFGLVLTEAMECGVPCVAFDCECGPSSIITNNADGILVEPGNIKAFSEGLLKLVASPQLRVKMGEQARITARRFKAETIMPHWENLFKELGNG